MRFWKPTPVWMHLETMGHAWLRRVSVIVALCTLALVSAGGLGYVSAHQKLAVPVGILIIALAIALQKKEPRAWIRRAGWCAAVSVLLQAALGMSLGRVFAATDGAIGHALLAQICFGLTTAVAAGQIFSIAGLSGQGKRGGVLMLTTASLLAQAGLGAAVHQQATGVEPHAIGATVATVLVMWAVFLVLKQDMDNARLRRPALLLLSLTFSQVFLGLGAAMNTLTTNGVAVLVWFRPAHVVLSSLTLGTAVILMLLVYGQARPMENPLAHRGVAVA